MNVTSLKSIVDTYRESLKGKKGTLVEFGEGGPVNMGTIDAIVAVLDGFEQRLMRLETVIKDLTKNQNGASN